MIPLVSVHWPPWVADMIMLQAEICDPSGNIITTNRECFAVASLYQQMLSTEDIDVIMAAYGAIFIKNLFFYLIFFNINLSVSVYFRY